MVLMLQLEYIIYCILSLFQTNKIPAIVLESVQNVVTKRNVKMSTPTRYVFVQVPRRRNPAVVAYRASESADGQITIQYGVSFCHNKDKFDRALGREIATGRLDRRPLTEIVGFSSDQKFGVVVTEAVRSIVSNAQTQIRSFYNTSRPAGTRAIADNDIELSLCDQTGVYVSLDSNG